ncbi:hypothetical protein G6F46_001022 [Rhizopus delemar]|uniref:Major facilitator superfamily (MFS) profile domain-containing protein n=2 Tax=Rhizopus TaxID=4842 RepID=A0A9P7CUW2_9FUNG|nr:hypothetical protein G6F43_001006 [Rhizopus delemar]KAG1553448.1 hypothetical protein G6F51_000596 [Rhizopus arrhizus]KAG1463338.1 hypothetical protein G6F55_002452 [Rhizopus delemar]KAG1501344.1 hypothetical protein G6F54_003103 [Rhizopus delemar]KAG1518223.1 hypothetical protein G6F53_000752 [Rhizopus delemar]
MVAITDKESTLSIDERIKVDHKDIRKSASSSLGSFTDSSADYNHSISGYVPDLKWTEEEEKKVLFKIDTKLMPFVLLMTFVLNMDRTNISNAISDHLPENLGFGITGVNTATLIYSITFTVVTLVTNPVAKWIGPHRWIPFLMFSWAIVTWGHVFLHNYSGFLAIRFFIALTEAGFIPSCLVYFTTWYKASELATRLAWFWGIQAFASAFSGLISFGIFRLEGVAGLYGWKWLFLIDGVFTHIIGFIAILYLPESPATTRGTIRGKYGWFTEREAAIAVTRIIEDDKYKIEQNAHVTWHDAQIAISDTKLWTHLLITFTSMMHHTPISTYFPKLINGYGFSVTVSNLLTVPANIINLFFSILIAKHADKKGYYAFHALIGCLWSMAGFLSLIILPNSAGRWNFYAAALFTASSPSFHGMHIAWMSSNVAPHGKRVLALGAIIGAANICGVPGSQIYQQTDSPRFIRGNWANFGIALAAAVLLIIQHLRYVLTNRYRSKKWNNLTESEKEDYIKNTKDEGSDRLDYRFRI